mgnify:FL=1
MLAPVFNTFHIIFLKCWELIYSSLTFCQALPYKKTEMARRGYLVYLYRDPRTYIFCKFTMQIKTEVHYPKVSILFFFKLSDLGTFGKSDPPKHGESEDWGTKTLLPVIGRSRKGPWCIGNEQKARLRKLDNTLNFRAKDFPHRDENKNSSRAGIFRASNNSLMTWNYFLR